MSTYTATTYNLACVGADRSTWPTDSSSLLVLAPDVDATIEGLSAPGVKLPIDSDFKNNTIAMAAPIFAALDAMPTPGTVACKSGRRARIVVAAWACVRHQGDADAAVAYLRSTGDADDAKPQTEQWVRGVIAAHTVSRTNPLIFRQLFEAESSTYTYLLADSVTREAILIDPVDITVERDLKVLDSITTPDGKSGLTLVAGLNTHCHADHITGTAQLKARLPHVQAMISERANSKADVLLKPHQKICFGKRWLEVLPTPGHTDGCVSFVLDDRSMVFTGDALLIGACGRTDFQQGSSELLFASVRNRIFTLSPDCRVFPAHDYSGRTSSDVMTERKTNPRLGDAKTVDEFVTIMAELKLAPPKKLAESVPANMLCGYPDEASWVPAKPN